MPGPHADARVAGGFGAGGGIEILVYDTVRSVRPDASDPMLIAQRLRDLGRLEQVWHGIGVRPQYVAAVRDGRTVGLLPMYPALGRHYLDWQAADLFPESERARSWRRGVFIGSDTTTPNALAGVRLPGVAAELVKAALVLARRFAPDHVCLPHLYDEQYDALRPALPRRSMLTNDSGEAVLDLTVDSFEDYVRLLPSRRTAIRRERRRFLAADHVLRCVPLVAVAGELAHLSAQVEHKYGGTGTTVESELGYLLGIAATMGDAGSALVVQRDGQVVAGSVMWNLGDEWRVRAWACDYHHPAVRRDHLYFNLMFYEPLLRARAAGARRLLLGTGSLKTKILRGARIRHRRNVAWEEGRDVGH